MGVSLVYAAYAVSALGALGVYWALPKDGRPSRRGVVGTILAAAIGAFLLLLAQLLGDDAQRVYLYVLSVLALGGAVRVVTHPRPVFSAIFFILVVLSTAAMLVLVGAEFLGAALVIVYAGAILVTYVFVIMLAQQTAPQSGGMFAQAMHYDRDAREPMAAVLAGFVLVGTIAGVIVGYDWKPHGEVAEATATATSNTLVIGRILMTDYAVSVELAGLLLTVAMVGAIALARKRIPHADDGAPMTVPGEIGRSVPPY